MGSYPDLPTTSHESRKGAAAHCFRFDMARQSETGELIKLTNKTDTSQTLRFMSVSLTTETAGTFVALQRLLADTSTIREESAPTTTTTKFAYQNALSSLGTLQGLILFDMLARGLMIHAC